MIQIVTTGGTIEGLDYENPKQRQANTRSIQDFMGKIMSKSEYRIEKLMDKDSRFITEEDRVSMAEFIESNDSNRILLTHGTISMVDTAHYLGELDLNKTIVLTGSFIPGTRPDTDAPFNLGFAIAVLRFLKRGVYIAMNGKIFNWNNVRKNLVSSQFETLSE